MDNPRTNNREYTVNTVSWERAQCVTNRRVSQNTQNVHSIHIIFCYKGLCLGI